MWRLSLTDGTEHISNDVKLLQFMLTVLRGMNLDGFIFKE